MARSASRIACAVWLLRDEDALGVFQNFDWPAAFAALQANTKLALTAQQQEAVQAALTHRVAVLTGGPGTGKTTTVRSIIRLAEAAGKRALLASPTGRAAKRLAEASGRPAKTIHRLLEYKPGEGITFQRNDENPLEADMLIVDEASMLDLLLTNNLLKAIPAGVHLCWSATSINCPASAPEMCLRDVIEAIEGEPGNGTTRRDARRRRGPPEHDLPPARGQLHHHQRPSHQPRPDAGASTIRNHAISSSSKRKTRSGRRN